MGSKKNRRRTAPTAFPSVIIQIYQLPRVASISFRITVPKFPVKKQIVCIYTINLRIIYLGELYIILFFFGGGGKGNHIFICCFLNLLSSKHQARRSLLAPWPVRAVWTMQWCPVATWDPWAVKGHMNCTSSLNGRKAPGGVGTTGEEKVMNNDVFLWIFWGERLELSYFLLNLKWWNRPERSGLTSMLHFQGAFGGVLVL